VLPPVWTGVVPVTVGVEPEGTAVAPSSSSQSSSSWPVSVVSSSSSQSSSFSSVSVSVEVELDAEVSTVVVVASGAEVSDSRAEKSAGRVSVAAASWRAIRPRACWRWYGRRAWAETWPAVARAKRRAQAVVMLKRTEEKWKKGRREGGTDKERSRWSFRYWYEMGNTSTGLGCNRKENLEGGEDQKRVGV